MNANLYIRSKADYALYQVALAKASDQQLIEISNELALELNLQEMKTIQAYFKAEDRNQQTLSCKPSAKHGQNTATTKPSREKS